MNRKYAGLLSASTTRLTPASAAGLDIVNPASDAARHLIGSSKVPLNRPELAQLIGIYPLTAHG